MSSKQVTDRQKTAVLVEAALATHGAAAAQVIAKKLRPVDAGQAPEVDTRLLLEQLRARLGRVREELVFADEANVAELGGDLVPRQSRDLWAREVFRSVSDLRGTLERVYGPGTSVRILSLEGQTAQDPVVLHRQAERLVQRCADEETQWPSIRYGSFQFNPAVAAEELRPKVEALGAALEEVARERRRAEATLRSKQAALTDFDQTYQAVAYIAKGVFVLADLKDLADRLRPPRRKTSSSPEEGPEGGEEASEESEALAPDASFRVPGITTPVQLPPLPSSAS